MLKLFSVIFLIVNGTVFAERNNLFQEFDDQLSIGYGINQIGSSFGFNSALPQHNDIITQTNILNLEVERLLKEGVWININANMTFGSGQVGSSPYLNPNDYGVNAKVGYAFTTGYQDVQLIPYGLIGLNNTASNGLASTGAVSNLQVANLFAYTFGAGGRVEVRLHRMVLLYADQLIAYNWDQSGPIGGIMPQNYMLYTSTLGIKINAVKNLQIGVRGYYNNYQQLASNFGAPMNGSGFAPFFAQPQNALGGLISVGVTY
jgi:hypothetical protein